MEVDGLEVTPNLLISTRAWPTAQICEAHRRLACRAFDPMRPLRSPFYAAVNSGRSTVWYASMSVSTESRRSAHASLR